jgi:hypothetical protein
LSFLLKNLDMNRRENESRWFNLFWDEHRLNLEFKINYFWRNSRKCDPSFLKRKFISWFCNKDRLYFFGLSKSILESIFKKSYLNAVLTKKLVNAHLWRVFFWFSSAEIIPVFDAMFEKKRYLNKMKWNFFLNFEFLFYVNIFK